MTWARVSSVAVAFAVALILLANTPAIVMDPIFTAVAQIRANAATTSKPLVPVSQNPETGSSSVTSDQKSN